MNDKTTDPAEKMPEEEKVSRHFIEREIDKDLRDGVYDNVHTRFPPEPNGYLHIGHAKSILLNYGMAQEYGGKFNLRFDDTNPTKEKIEFVESIKADVQWLGAEYEDRLFFASNYFQEMYEVAVKLINGLSTAGLSLTTSKNGKGNIGITLTGHVSISNQDAMPMEFYSIDGDGLAALSLYSEGGASGKTKITASGYTPSSSESYKYKLASAPVSVAYEDVLTTGWSSWDGSADIVATTGQYITVAVVVTASNKAKAAGSVMVTATAS